jgi:glutathione S-transferase
MLTIYGNPMSTCTRKVLMTLAETNTPHEMSIVDFAKAEHKQPANLARQPFGRVPALEDDGFTMFESRAICRYLNERASGKLVPSDAKARAKMEQWISVEMSEFTPNAMKFIYEHVFKRPQEAGVLAAAGAALETSCALLDKQLGQTPYLAGKELSLADICFMPYFEYAMNTPANEVFAKYPNVMAWWKKVSDLPSWKKVTGKA